jgi:NAD(P)-dependent dehydrogenase (short-subunit alcohol dehydrogenase family)
MVSKGARNLVLVSRSGSATGKVKELIDELALDGAKTVVKSCDVGDNKAVQALIQDLASMPEIRGVIHGAMVLHVCSL